jgi:hypothetical protein
MRRLLLTVENHFVLSQWGWLLLAPSLPLTLASLENRLLAPPSPKPVIPKLPEGVERTANARFASAQHNLPYSEPTLENTWRLDIALVGIAPEDVPLGTEVWIVFPEEL